MNFGFVAPYAATIRTGLIVAAGFSVIGLGWSWHARGAKIDRLNEWQDQVLSATALAGGFKDLDPEDVVTVITVVGVNARECQAKLTSIDAATKAAKVRSDARDEALQATLAEQRQRYDAASRRIKSLEQRQAAPDAVSAARQIEDDSKAAWEGWGR